MSIMEKLFGQRQQPAPAPAPANPSNNPAANPAPPAPASSQQTAPNGVVPPGGAEAPLDKFKDLWQPIENQGNEQQTDTPVDPQKLMEAAAKVDFSKIADPASLQKIAAGGEEAVGALVQLLNKTAQTVYGQSAVTTAKIVEQAVSQAQERFTAQVPEMLRKQNVRSRVFEENPAFSNPAVAPLIEAQVQQLANKYPKATQAELTNMAKEYLMGVAGLINPAKTDASANQQTGKDEVDWDKYLS